MRHTNFVIVSLCLLCSSFTFAVQAADLEGDMLSLSAGLSTVLNSQQASEMQQALTQMRDAAQDAKTATPPSLAGSAPQSPAMQGWRDALDQLIAKVNQAEQQVKLGKLDEAKKTAQQIAALRNENHRKYR